MSVREMTPHGSLWVCLLGWMAAVCVVWCSVDDEVYVGGRFGSFEDDFYSFANLQVRGKKSGGGSDGSDLEWGYQAPSLYSAGDLYDLAVNESHLAQMYISGQFTPNETFSAIVVCAPSLSHTLLLPIIFFASLPLPFYPSSLCSHPQCRTQMLYRG